MLNLCYLKRAYIVICLSFFLLITYQLLLKEFTIVSQISPLPPVIGIWPRVTLKQLTESYGK